MKNDTKMNKKKNGESLSCNNPKSKYKTEVKDNTPGIKTPISSPRSSLVNPVKVTEKGRRASMKIKKKQIINENVNSNGRKITDFWESIQNASSESLRTCFLEQNPLVSCSPPPDQSEMRLQKKPQIGSTKQPHWSTEMERGTVRPKVA